MYRYLLFFYFYTIKAKIIKNANVPSCTRCIHYKADFFNDYSSSLGKNVYILVQKMSNQILFLMNTQMYVERVKMNVV